MRIAVTYENGEVFQHFGHTTQFKVYDVDDGKVISAQIVDTNGRGHDALVEVLKELHADTIICGGIGGNARNAVNSFGIKLYGGVIGDADAAVESFLVGNLNYNPDIKCVGHNGDHHGTEHECSHGTCSDNSPYTFQ